MRAPQDLLGAVVSRTAVSVGIPLSRPALPHLTVRGVSATRALRILLTIAVFCMPILTFLPFLSTPFMRDEAFYASVAQAMDHGAMPYEYGFDNKPPMVFYWYFASFQVFGETVWAPRLLASLLLAGCSVLVYMQGRMLFSHHWGLVAAFIFGISTGIAKFESNANTEYFLIPVLMLALVSFTLGQRQEKWYWYLLAGGASAMALLTKQTAVFFPLLFAGFLVLPLVYARGLRGSAPFWRAAGLMTLGGLTASVAVLLPFAVTGTLDDLYRGTVVYAGEYAGQLTWQEKLSTLAQSVPRQLIKTAGPLSFMAAAGAILVIRKPDRNRALLLAWTAAAAGGVLAAGRFYPHYFVTVLPGMALLTVPFLQWLKSNWASFPRPGSQPIWVSAGVVLLVALSVWPVITNGRVYLQTSANARHMQKYDGNPMSEWEVQARDAGAWIAQLTRPGEKIYEFGFMPSVYFYADRESPTQFTFKHPFAINEAYAREAVSQMQADKPVLIFDSAAYERDGPFTYHGRTVTSFLKQHYVYAGKHFFGDVWLLRGWQPAVPVGTPDSGKAALGYESR
ncbi:MAG TPA: glycosyltransferase family 39 protein [Dehalococcoidia bacterium]|nr:glycosyltransferase family 39 protein [Dehalococcoidia bacterium]